MAFVTWYKTDFCLYWSFLLQYMLKQGPAYESVFLIAFTPKKGLEGAPHGCDPGLQLLSADVLNSLNY